MSKIEEHAGIQIPIYYYEDDNGNKVYDFEEMANEFEQKLSELDETAVVMCSVETKNKEYKREYKPWPGLDEVNEVKHFADGFHEGRWEDDVEYSEFAHLSTDRVDKVKYDGDGKPLKSVKDSDNCYSEFDD